MKSKNVRSEIVFSLSPNNNISEFLKRFGISDATKDVLAIKVGDDRSQIEEHLLKHVEGKPVPFADNELAGMRDEGRVRKAYKLDLVGKDAEPYVLGWMALKRS